MQSINEGKRQFFREINNIDKPLAQLPERHKEKIQIYKGRYEKWMQQKTPRKYKE